MAELDPTGATIQLGDLGLRTPMLTGTADARDATIGPSVRSVGGTSAELQDAFDRAGITTTHVVELRAFEIGAGAGGGTARAAGAGGAIQLDVPAPAAGFEQAVLSVDERGVTTWSFAPEPERGAALDATARAGGRSRTFTIRRSAPGAETPASGASRSIFGEVGKQLLKVVAFPVGRLVGEAGNSFLDEWERTHQGYGIRDFTAANHSTAAPYFDGDPARWEALSGGRTLLFIHGTFSRAQGGFGGLPLDAMQRLETLYEGRVIAFDQQTISHDPAENIDWLLERIPDGTQLDLDIICHSRGGLVARSLSERIDPFPGTRKVRVHRAALVGAVNSGTILADVGHWNDLIDTLSTVLNTVGVGIPEMVDLILAFVRQVAVAAYPSLRGLACMVPGGPFLADLNGRPRGANTYLAVASNYEPLDRSLRAYFDDVVRDAIFSEQPNDSLVRVDSVCGGTGPGDFAPVADRLLLDASEGVEHSAYFRTRKVADGLVDWLGAGLAQPT